MAASPSYPSCFFVALSLLPWISRSCFASVAKGESACCSTICVVPSHRRSCRRDDSAGELHQAASAARTRSASASSLKPAIAASVWPARSWDSALPRRAMRAIRPEPLVLTWIELLHRLVETSQAEQGRRGVIARRDARLPSRDTRRRCSRTWAARPRSAPSRAGERAWRRGQRPRVARRSASCPRGQRRRLATRRPSRRRRCAPRLAPRQAKKSAERHEGDDQGADGEEHRSLVLTEHLLCLAERNRQLVVLQMVAFRRFHSSRILCHGGSAPRPRCAAVGNRLSAWGLLSDVCFPRGEAGFSRTTMSGAARRDPALTGIGLEVEHDIGRCRRASSNVWSARPSAAVRVARCARRSRAHHRRPAGDHRQGCRGRRADSSAGSAVPVAARTERVRSIVMATCDEACPAGSSGRPSHDERHPNAAPRAWPHDERTAHYATAIRRRCRS